LLRRVARKLDGQDRGLRGLVPEIRARGLGPSALLGFVRDWRDDGQLIMSPTRASEAGCGSACCLT
jgi:hypothetical protein